MRTRLRARSRPTRPISPPRRPRWSPSTSTAGRPRWATRSPLALLSSAPPVAARPTPADPRAVGRGLLRPLPTAPLLSPLPRGGHLLAHTIGSRVDGLLEELWNAGGTDLLLTAGTAPQSRVHGALQPVQGARPLTFDDTESMVAEVLSPAQSAAF